MAEVEWWAPRAEAREYGFDEETIQFRGRGDWMDEEKRPVPSVAELAEKLERNGESARLDKVFGMKPLGRPSSGVSPYGRGDINRRKEAAVRARETLPTDVLTFRRLLGIRGRRGTL